MTSRFSERSLEVCSKFLQTAVIIDDKLHFTQSNKPEIIPVKPGRNQKPSTFTGSLKKKRY